VPIILSGDLIIMAEGRYNNKHAL